jgi:hypothetical protein
MQTVSAAYKEQMRKKWRNPSYVRVSYGVFNLAAIQQAQFADNGHTVYGNLNLNDDILPDRDYATFEKDYWRADGKQLILPAASPYNYDGFVSSAVSDVTTGAARGKNLFDKSKVQAGFIDLNTGAIGPSTTYPNSKYGDFIPTTEGTVYYISGYNNDFRYRLYDADKNYDGYVAFTAPGPWTATQNGYMRPLFYLGATQEQLDAVQIEKSPVATSYEAFIGSVPNTFTSNPTITVSFTDPQDIFGLTFTFPEGQVPQEIKVNGTTYNPDSELYVMPDRLQDVTSIAIEFVKAPSPGRRVRLNRLQFGRSVVFQNRQIIKTSFESSIDFLSLSLTQKKLAVTVDNREQIYNPLNPQGLYGYLEAKQPMEIDYGYELDNGTVEWIVGDNLVLESTPIAADTQASFSAVDSLTNLTGMFYHGLYRPQGISLYDLAKEVLDDAGVEHYVIDDHLKDVYTKAALPVVTHRECLQIIANAGQCILYTDRRGYIKLEIALDPTIQVGDNWHMIYSSSDSAYNDMDLPTTKYADFLPDSWKAAGKKILLPASGPYIRTGFVSDKICGADGDFNKNLLPNSATIPGLHGWAPSGSTPAVDQGNGFYRVPLNSSVFEILQDQNISVVQGSAYTESFYFKTDSTDLKFDFTFFNAGVGHQPVKATIQSLGDNLFRASATYTAISNSIRAIDFNNFSYSNGTYIDIAKPQLEIGPYATDYSPQGTYPTIYWTYSFPYSSYQIPVTFDNVDGEYAADFDVVYKLDGAEIDRVSVTGNTAVKYTVEHFVEKTDRIEIEIHKWCRGTRRAMIAQIGDGRVNDMNIDFNTATEKPIVEKSSQVKTVTVNCYGYTPSAAATELYHENITPSGPITLNISHEAASEISATVTGVKGDDDTVSETDAVITAQTHYAYYSTVTLTGTQPCTLTLTGKVLTPASVGVVKQINPQGEDKPALQNPLITDLTNAQNTAAWIADYFNKRSFLTTTYRGNPEIDAHDLIYMESQFEKLFPARVMNHKIEFNGALSGSIKAVKMNG